MDGSPIPQLIVVGIDGSAGAQHALEWSLAEATLRNAQVEAVYAWQSPLPPGELSAVAGWDPNEYRAAKEEELRSIVEAVLRSHPDVSVPVARRFAEGSPAAVLLGRQEDADLLVVGTRGRGGLSAVLLGSTSIQILHHARKPVAVVPASAPLELHGDVVVGVDGSPGSKQALVWALQEAARRACPVRVVHAWTTPAAGPHRRPLLAPRSSEAYRASATVLLESMVDEALAAIGKQPMVQLRAVEAPAVSALLGEAVDAALVVLGARGRGGFAGLLLGSVSHQYVHHTRCAVVVVPEAAAATYLQEER